MESITSGVCKGDEHLVTAKSGSENAGKVAETTETGFSDVPCEKGTNATILAQKQICVLQQQQQRWRGHDGGVCPIYCMKAGYMVPSRLLAQSCMPTICSAVSSDGRKEAWAPAWPYSGSEEAHGPLVSKESMWEAVTSPDKKQTKSMSNGYQAGEQPSQTDSYLYDLVSWIPE